MKDKGARALLDHLFDYGMNEAFEELSWFARAIMMEAALNL